MNEADFLARIRSRNVKSERLASPGRYGAVVRSLGEDWVAEFAARLTAVGGHVHQVSDAAEARVRLRDLLHGRRLQRAALTAHPILKELEFDSLIRRMGLELILADGRDNDEERAQVRAAIAQADVGLTGAEYGLAASGSLVMMASPEHARSISLLPPLHIAVLRRQQILPDLAALSQRIQDDDDGRLPSGPLPSGLVLITGPSRTADIEQTLSIGVHGPGEIHVVLL